MGKPKRVGFSGIGIMHWGPRSTATITHIVPDDDDDYDKLLESVKEIYRLKKEQARTIKQLRGRNFYRLVRATVEEVAVDG